MNYQELLDRKIKEWGIEGVHPELIRTALMHPSYDMDGKRNNQRLEFLGDAVLGLIIGEYLFTEYTQWQEGDLTRNRAYLAKEPTLAKVAKEIGIDSVLLLGKGEEKDGGRNRPSTLADAMEALIAAIYLSFGLGRAERFVLRYFGGIEKPRDDQEEVICDYKTELQEYVQKFRMENVTYQIISEDGPPHLRVFTAGVYHCGRLIGTGQGKTKKAAEKAAAGVGLETLKKERNDGQK
ncbi:MAG: ribonuclease III [Firmicutes bacterium]|nr:ribonuclease III [Bacillota bacterium]